MKKSAKQRSERQKEDRGEGRFFLLPQIVLESEAYRTASLRAKAVLLAILSKFNGTNNGRIGISVDEISHAIGFNNPSGSSAAVGELVARGLVAIAKTHAPSCRKSREYRLTWIEWDDEAGRRCKPTNEYRSWQPGDAGTIRKRSVKKRPSMIETGNPQRVSMIEVGRKQPVSMIETGSAPEASVPVSIIEGLLDDNHGYGAAAGPSLLPEALPMPAERLAPVPPRTRSLDAFIVAQRIAATNPAAPEPEVLRALVDEFLDRAGRGGQSKLCQFSGVPTGSLSRFRAGRLALDPDARLRISRALPRARGFFGLGALA